MRAHTSHSKFTTKLHYWRQCRTGTRIDMQINGIKLRVQK